MEHPFLEVGTHRPSEVRHPQNVGRAADPTTRNLITWRGMAWWEQEKAKPDKVGARHAGQFNPHSGHHPDTTWLYFLESHEEIVSVFGCMSSLFLDPCICMQKSSLFLDPCICMQKSSLFLDPCIWAGFVDSWVRINDFARFGGQLWYNAS